MITIVTTLINAHHRFISVMFIIWGKPIDIICLPPSNIIVNVIMQFTSQINNKIIHYLNITTLFLNGVIFYV